MNRNWVVRRPFLIGLSLAALLGVVLLAGVLGSDDARLRGAGAEREGIIALRSLVDMVERTGTEPARVQSAVEQFHRSVPGTIAVRVVLFEGLQLLASTDPQDKGERAAPRRLLGEEKPLYDTGQELRAAADTNREDQVARKEEIQVKRIPDGQMALYAPLERDKAIVGTVQLTIRTQPLPALGFPWGPVSAAFLFVVAVGVGLAFAFGERRWLLLVGGMVVFLLTFVLLSRHSAGRLAEEGQRVQERTGMFMVQQKQQVEKLLAAIDPALAQGIHSSTWDSDLFRRPRGIFDDQGRFLTGKAADESGSIRWRRQVSGIGLLAMALLTFFAVGWAGKLGVTLVRHRHAYFFILPAMAGMLLLVFYPFFYGITLSFTGQTIYNTDKPITEIWVGFQNFLEILGDFKIANNTPDGWAFNYQNFYWTLFMTIAWTISNVATGVTVGLILALILNQKGFRFKPIYRVILILPWAIPNYITALIWKGMFHQQFGVVNQIIAMLGGKPIAWFEGPFTSFLTCYATNAWLSFPFMMVIALGALQSIPSDLYEAARVDGASRLKQFTSITLPSLKPALVPAVILSVVWTFNMFNIIYLVSGGEPAHSTEILITQAYKLAFEQYRYGYAAAYSTVIFGILLVYGTWQNRVTRATEGI